MREPCPDVRQAVHLRVPALSRVFPRRGGSGAVNIAVYWGQNASESTLSDTCGGGLYSYVNLAFLSTFGSGHTPVLDLADHCDAASGTCASLAADIASCQSAGVKVLLSIGGGALGGYNLSSLSDAQGVATYLWDNFLGGAGAPRPLGDAVLDGIDFDIEAASRHYDDLARNLTSLFAGEAAGRKYVLAAAPQCPFPDASLAAALGTGRFDRVWVQFYNNPPCQYAPGDVGALLRAWQQRTASLPSATVFLGLPASLDAAGSGFVDADTLASQVLPVVEGAANYGGVMLWSRSYDKDSGFSVKLQGILQNRNDQGASLNKKKRIYIILGVAVAGVLLLFLLISTCFLCHKKCRGKPAPEEGSTTPPKTEPSLSQALSWTAVVIFAKATSVKKMVIVGLWFIQTTQMNRPSMSRVVEMLESSSVDLELLVRISLEGRKPRL